MSLLFRSLGVFGLTTSDWAFMELERALRPSCSREVAHRWMRRYGRQVVRLFNGRIAGPLPSGDPLPGRDARGVGRLFVMNHRSMFDIFVYLSVAEAVPLSRGDLAGWPIIGPAARRVGTVFVDRTDKKSGSAAVKAMADALTSGRGIFAFPEGTTFAGDEVRPLRIGAFVAALRAKAEIVPLGIAYQTDDACYLDETFGAHWKRITNLREIRVGLVAGDPLAPEGEAEALRDRTHAAIQALVLRARESVAGRS
jgi:1-acyl-sn-glycerol-3-phosphate acyltransferase